MYNAKIIKYPAGYQVRLYSQPVGVCYEKEPVQLSDRDCTYVPMPCEDGDTAWVSVPDGKWWQNPFTEEYEPSPHIECERDHERSIKVSMARTVNKVYDMARSNLWEWFFTLTFSPEKVDSYDYGECTKKLSKWLNNMRTASPDMMYLVVPEKHKKGRYHFHGVFAGCEGIDFVDSGKTVKGIVDEDVIYNVGNYRLGFTTATKVKDCEKVVKYVTKYITKELCGSAIGKKRYWASRNVKTADSIELVLDTAQLQELRSEMREHIKHEKILESGMLRAEYYELDLKKGDDCIGYIAI